MNEGFYFYTGVIYLKASPFSLNETFSLIKKHVLFLSFTITKYIYLGFHTYNHKDRRVLPGMATRL